MTYRGYDLGGGMNLSGNPFGGCIIVVDMVPPTSDVPFIQRNLENPFDLEPAQFAIVSKLLRDMFDENGEELTQKLLKFAQELHQLVIPGGFIKLLDDAVFVGPVMFRLLELGWLVEIGPRMVLPPEDDVPADFEVILYRARR